MGGYVALKATGGRTEVAGADALYNGARPNASAMDLTYIPYALWAHRGAGEMRVWVREA